MNPRQQFLNTLQLELSSLPKESVDEILRDQEEYLRDAIASGRTEIDVLESLGDPKSLAATLRTEFKIDSAQKSLESARHSHDFKQRAGSTLKALLALLALAPLNLIFVLGPFCLALFFLVMAWALAAATPAAAIGMILTFFAKLVFVPAGFWSHSAYLLFSFGLLSLGWLLVLFMFHFTRLFFTLTLNYLKWNLDFIRNRPSA